MSLLLGGAGMGKKLCLTFLNGVVSIDSPINLTHLLLLFSAFKCWCQAAWQYSTDFPSHLPQDGDVM
jgi:hypothetical protein